MPASERRDVSVLFADISGFTAMSEKLDPEAVTDFMNRCFVDLEGVVLAHGGVVDKFIGDCVLAVFPHPGMAASAAQAAVEMRSAIQALNAEETLPAPLDVHIGIATGPVIVGEIGGARTRARTVSGDTVAAADRLQHEAERGEIALCPRTRAETVYAAPPDLATDMPSLGLLSPAPPGARRPSERRQATVLFADVRGLEALEPPRPPDELTALMNQCFALADTAVHAYGGVIDKYIGGCVMALFGVPNAIEHAPRQAINAAIEMRRLLGELRAELPTLSVRIGINTGLVIAGEIGGRQRRDFTVMGDTVNLASRLKDAARDWTITVGPETERATGTEFEYASPLPLRLKGKERPVPVHELRSARERVHRARGAAIGLSTLVGRERELAELEAAVVRLAAGQGGVVSVIGEAGLGKSRLLAELGALETKHDVTVLEGRCVSVGHGLSFHPFVDLLRHWARIEDDADDAVAGEKLAAAVQQALPDEMGDVLPFLAMLMGIRLGGEHAARIEGLEGEAMEEMIFRSVRRLFERLAGTRPLLLLFEDLHWADLSSVKLLETLLRLVTEHAIVFTCVGRPDFPDTLGRVTTVAREGYGDRYVALVLTRLSEPQCAAIVENLLGMDDLPQSTRALIIRKADGNPFYLEEVVRSLVEQGALTFRDGRYHRTEKIDSVVIPETIQEVILSRVDRLDEPTRHVLQLASVVGRSFQHRILAAILGTDEDIDARLAELIERRLLSVVESRRTASLKRTRLHAEREYVFTHALLQETIYGAILQRTRRRLHAQVARATEEEFADRLVDFYGMLAFHYSQAEHIEKAEEYLFKAGEEAARAAASIESLNFFREASRLYFQMHGEGGDPRKKALLEKSIGLALLNHGDLTESIEHFDQALAHLGERVPRNRATAALYFARDMIGLLGQLYVRTPRQRAVTDWEREREVYQILFNRGRAEITSDPTRLFFDMVGGFRRINRIDARQIDQASAMVASAATVFCYSGLSFAVSARALDIARRLIRPGNVRDTFTVACMDFIHPYLLGDWHDRHVIDEELVEEAIRHGQLWDVNTYLGLYCDRLLRQGEFGRARGLLERLHELDTAFGYTFAGANRDGMTALLLAEERRLPEALAAIDGYTQARHEDALRVLGLGTRAKIQMLSGDTAAATASLAAAEKITTRSREVPPWHLSAYAVGRLRCDLTALEKARHSLPTRHRARRSMRYALRIAARVAIQRTEIEQLAGRVLWVLGRRRSALLCWRRAIATGERLGARPELARTWAMIAHALESDPGRTFDGMAPERCRERARALFAEIGLESDVGQEALAARVA